MNKLSISSFNMAHPALKKKRRKERNSFSDILGLCKKKKSFQITMRFREKIENAIFHAYWLKICFALNYNCISKIAVVVVVVVIYRSGSKFICIFDGWEERLRPCSIFVRFKSTIFSRIVFIELHINRGNFIKHTGVNEWRFMTFLSMSENWKTNLNEWKYRQVVRTFLI